MTSADAPDLKVRRAVTGSYKGMNWKMASKRGFVGALAISCLARPRGVTAADPPRRIEIVAKRFSYAPSEITLKKGEPVVLVLRSEDVPHGIKFKELNLQTEIGKGMASELSFTPAVTGDFVGHCSHFCGSGHGSMTLTMHVTE
jgi:cytochrome c oxidase subunit II